MRAKSSRKILEIEVGDSCNNNCIFCIDHVKHKLDVNKINSDIKNHKSMKKIRFAYKEPTLNKNLLKFVKISKECGYQTITITTNGRMLSYKKYLLELIKLGVNDFTVSIHGHNAKIHDSLTQTPGSFQQTKKGLENLCSLVRKPFTLHIASTITSKNIMVLSELHSFVQKFNPSVHIFNLIEPRGHGKECFPKLSFKYTEFVTQIKKLKIQKPNISVTDIPFCVARDIKEILGLREKQYFVIEKGLFAKSLQSIKEKKDTCKNCIKFDLCQGVWKEYIKLYGWEEFQPIKVLDTYK